MKHEFDGIDALLFTAFFVAGGVGAGLASFSLEPLSIALSDTLTTLGPFNVTYALIGSVGSLGAIAFKNEFDPTAAETETRALAGVGVGLMILQASVPEFHNAVTGSDLLGFAVLSFEGLVAYTVAYLG